MGLVEILTGHMKRDAMKAQRYNNLNYLQTCNMWLGSMLNEPVCIHGDPALPRYDHLQAPYRNANLMHDQYEHNKTTSEVQILADWLLEKFHLILDFCYSNLK